LQSGQELLGRKVICKLFHGGGGHPPPPTRPEDPLEGAVEVKPKPKPKASPSPAKPEVGVSTHPGTRTLEQNGS
jgi:hypothetical protein